MKFVTLTMILAVLPCAARAQDSGIHWFGMGGYSNPLGQTADYLQGGFTLGGGFSIAPTWMGPLKLRFDLDYSQHNATIAALETGAQAANTEVDYGTGSIFGASGNLVYYIPVVYGVRAYAIGGVGIYHSRIELDQGLPFYGGYGFGYGYGYGYGGVDVASHSATNVGWNGGAGLEFALPSGNSWFLESRYHHLGSIEYLPVEIGFRF